MGVKFGVRFFQYKKKTTSTPSEIFFFVLKNACAEFCAHSGQSHLYRECFRTSDVFCVLKNEV